MIEEIIDGIWEDIMSNSLLFGEFEIKRRWRIIIRKAIAESQKSEPKDGWRVPWKEPCPVHGSSQAMLEETAVMER